MGKVDRAEGEGQPPARRAWRWGALGLFALGVLGLRASAPPRPLEGDVCPDDTRWADLIGEHVGRYPSLAPADLYKLLHQATMGSEHAVGSEMASRFMERELAGLESGPDEPAVDTLGRGGRFARVHLRPFLAEGGVPERLVEAFVSTATEATPDRAALECALGVAADLSRGGALPWASDRLASFLEARRRGGFPAVDHSGVYADRYRPAYRVVAVRLLSHAWSP